MGASTWLSDFGQDLRLGLRALRHTPTFTLVTLVTLALAIGANTAIFSLVDLLVLRDLPVRDPASLVEFRWRYPGDPPMNSFAPEDYELYRARNTVFSDIIGTAPVRIDAPASGSAGETLNGEYVTGRYFPVLALQAALGRLPDPRDDRPGATPVAVLSWRYWKNRFNLDPRALGTQIIVNGQRVTVVGVTERDFSGLVLGYQTDVWVSAAAYRGKEPLRFMLLARLERGTSIERAQAEMRVLDRPRIERFARNDPQWRTVTLTVESARAGMATPLHEQFVRPVLVLMAVVAILLLLACANIGSLLLARTAARQRDTAIRVVLGARRSRIVRQVLTESLILSVAGGMLGAMAALFGASTLVRIVASGTRLIGLPPRVDITIDGRVLMFTAAVTLLATVLFGMVPAWAAFTSAPAVALKEGPGAGQAGSRRAAARGLVTAQVALSLVLLTLSQVFVGHLSQLRSDALGFSPSSVLLVSVDLAHVGLKREQINPLYPELLGRLQAIPGVRSATVSGMTPISGAAGSRFVSVEGFEEPPEARRRLALNGVAPNYFATLGTPLIAGRDFLASDANGARVAIVNQAMARRYFGDRTPIGKHIRFDGEPLPLEIVGLVGDAKYVDVRVPAPPIMYMFHTDLAAPASEFSLHTSVPPLTVAGAVRRVIGSMLRNARVTKITTLADQVDASIVPERLISTLSGFFGVVGVLLAAVGLYGLLAYSVARRTNEIGLRIALGAGRGDVIGLVLRNSLSTVGAGLAIGAPAAIWSKRIAASMLPGVPGGGVGTVVVAAALVVAVALLAAYVPVRRATRVDPSIALRSE